MTAGNVVQMQIKHCGRVSESVAKHIFRDMLIGMKCF